MSKDTKQIPNSDKSSKMIMNGKYQIPKPKNKGKELQSTTYPQLRLSKYVHNTYEINIQISTDRNKTTNLNKKTNTIPQ